MRRQRQRGVTLIVSLIMLVLLTIMALTSFNIGKSNLQIVDNAQQHAQALNAAQTIVNEVISNPVFAESPTNVLDNSNCPPGLSAPANSRCVDVNGDGKTVIVVAMSPAPACKHAAPIPNTDLDLANAQSADFGCALGEQQNHGIVGAATGDSLCAESLWEINADATEAISGAKTVVTRGVAMRVSKDSVDTTCPAL